MAKRNLILRGLALAACLGLAGAAAAQVVPDNHPADPHHVERAKPAFTCGDCHDCEQPTAEEPCLATCPRHGSHFYGTHAADEGPDVVVIDQLANLYKPVIFSHRLHAQMSTMTGGCENCHHYSEQSGSIPPCRQCHDPDSNEVSLGQPALKGAYHRQCMNCHRDWAHDNACAFCHDQADGSAGLATPDSTDIVGVPHPLIEATATYLYETTYAKGPLVTFHHGDHVDLFGLQCVDCHRGDSCARCHDSRKEKHAKLDHLTTCCTCHAERNCAFCHSQQTQPRFAHEASTGWDLAPHHTQVACTVCHGAPQVFKTPSWRCTSCHIHWEVGSFNHSVTGLSLGEEHVDLDCDSCHQKLDFSVPPTCTDCHDEAMYPQRLPGKRITR